MLQRNRNISLRVLRTFEAAATRLSFREAAEDMYITSSAVSHQIKQLESTLSTVLFERLPQGLALTQSGQELFNALTPILDDLDQLLEQHSRATTARKLRLAVHPMLASELLAPNLSQFLDQHPDWTVKMQSSGLHDPEFPADASIRLHKTPPDTPVAERLFDLELCPLGNRELYDSIKVVGNRIVTRIPIILQRERPDAWSRWQKAVKLRLPRDCPTISMNSMAAVAKAAEGGLGAGLLSPALCSRSIASGVLVPLFERTLTTQESFYFSTSPDPAKAQIIHSLRDWLVAEFASVS